MRKITKYLISAFLASLFALPAFAQIGATFTRTTLSAAVSATDFSWRVASSTDFIANTTFAYIDGELVNIRAVSGTRITVVRGMSGTRAVAHPVGSTITVGGVAGFSSYNPTGTCTAGHEAINLRENTLNKCYNTVWVNMSTAKIVRYTTVLAADAVDRDLFIADRPYEIVSATYSHKTAAGAAANVELEKCTGTTASGSGTEIQTNNTNAGFDSNATADTVQTATWVTTRADLQLAAGDRIAADFTGTHTSTAGIIITIVLKPR